MFIFNIQKRTLLKLKANTLRVLTYFGNKIMNIFLKKAPVLNKNKLELHFKYYS